MINYDQENGHLRPTFDLFECIRARRDNRDFTFYYETNDGHMYHCTITGTGIEPAYLMSPHYALLAHNIVLNSIDFSIEDISFHYEMNVICRTTNDTFVSEYVLPYFIELTNCVLNKTNGFSCIYDTTRMHGNDGIIEFIKTAINAFQDDAVKELFDEFVVRVWLNPNTFVTADTLFPFIKELHYAHKDYLFKHLTMEQRNAMLFTCDEEQEYELKAELVHYSNPINPSDDKDRWSL